MLSREQHEGITQDKLVRKRTMAKQRSDRAGASVSSINMHDLDPDGSPAATMTTAAAVAAAAPSSPRLGSAGTSPRLVPRHPPQGPPGLPQGPTQAQPRAYPTQQRYTLVDPGTGSIPVSPPVMGNSGFGSLPQEPGSSYARQAGRPPGQRSGSGPGPGPGPGPMPSPVMHPAPNGASGGPGVGPERSEGAEHVQQTRRPPGKSPSTFAEMGIQGAKLEEKDCVIM